MPYSSNIPQAADLLNASQRDLLDNFIELKTAIDVNHGTFGAADQGKHKWVSIPANPQPPAPAAGANELILLDSISRFTNRPELGFRAGGTNTIATMSASRHLFAFTAGWAPLSPGLVIKWGAIEGTGVTLVRFPRGPEYPDFIAAPYHVTVSAAGAVNNLDVFAHLINIINERNFTVMCQNRTQLTNDNVTIHYLAIGPV